MKVDELCQLVRANEPLWNHFLRWIRNFLCYLLPSSQTPLTKILNTLSDHVSLDTILHLRSELLLSKTYIEFQKHLVTTDDFNISTFVDVFGQKQWIQFERQNQIKSNFIRCLQIFHYANAMIEQVGQLRTTTYDATNPIHEEQLEQLWKHLKPDVRRRGGRITKEWGEIGFQGEDPKTDFRSMGMLSLEQLVYFSRHYPVEAQQVLADSNHPTRWYPFSVTGIHISSFMMDLLRSRLLDHVFYRTASDSDAKVCSSQEGMEKYHEFYCTLFIRFNHLWQESKPRDVMSFPPIFSSFQNTVRQECIHASFKY